VIDLLAFDARALQRLLDGDAAKLCGIERSEPTAHLADGGASAAENDCL